jgi:hypothetical protein
LRRRPGNERKRLARMILAGRFPVHRMGEDWAVTNAHGDFWTRGTEPAGLAIRNSSGVRRRHRIVVQSGRSRPFPFRFHVDDGARTHDYVFERAGSLTVDLATVPARAERLFVIWSDQEWQQGARHRGSLGIRFQPAEARPARHARRPPSSGQTAGARPRS